MNFVEGTRFTARKHDKQAAPYRHLLHPRAGGIAFTLAAMGEDQLYVAVDVTIAYPGGIPSYWDFMCGRVRRSGSGPLSADRTQSGGDCFNDPEFQQEFQ